MIVRISGEGQYELADDALTRVNQLDDTVVQAVDAGDETAFGASFAELLTLVRAEGRALEGDDLSTSDAILPPPDSTLAQAREALDADGLIPG